MFPLPKSVAFLVLSLLGCAAAPAAESGAVTKVRQFPRHPQGSVQGMCITPDGLLIQGYNHGYVRIFDLNRESNEPIADFEFASAGKDNHANAISLSGTYYRGNTIPLLYITGGQPTNGLMECHVEDIRKTADGYRAERVQRITLDEDFAWGMKPEIPYRTEDGFHRIWGAPSFLVDTEGKCLYVLSAIYRTTKSYAKFKDENRYVVTKLRLPDLVSPEVKLTRQDVLDQIIYDYDVFVTQSGYYRDGKIYFTFGFGRNRESLESSQIRVFDVHARRIVGRYDLAEAIPEEFESCAFWQGKFHAVTQLGNLYRIEL